MKVLLVWQEIPEETKFYSIENPDKELLEHLKNIENKFQNSSDFTDKEQESMDLISNKIAEEEFGSNVVIRKKLHEFGAFDMIFTCGFIV